jgi:hypothetical protein
MAAMDHVSSLVDGTYMTAEPYISPSGSEISSMRSPSGPGK